MSLMFILYISINYNFLMFQLFKLTKISLLQKDTGQNQF